MLAFWMSTYYQTNNFNISFLDELVKHISKVKSDDHAYVSEFNYLEDYLAINYLANLTI